MTSKVFLFENDHWLYCSDVTVEDGVYHGWVVNGAWEMWATDTTVKSRQHTHETKIVWACDPNTMSRDYNGVIDNAKARYELGEPADYVLKEVVNEDEESSTLD
jgi:hypothetical protein